MLPFPQRVTRLAEVLSAARIPYAFGGAIALNYYAEPRATTDVDINIFLVETNSEATLHALMPLGMAIDFDAATHRLACDGQIRLLWDVTFVDLFFSTVPFLDSAAGRVRLVPWEGRHIPILSPEDLFVCKVIYNRPKDWYDLRVMLLLTGSELDRAYIDYWLEDMLGADDPRIARAAEIFTEMQHRRSQETP